MKTKRFSAVLFALALLASNPPVHAAGDVPGAGKMIEQTVEFKDLERYVGQVVKVRTKYNTQRAGTLIKYTSAGILLKLSAREGGIELQVPANNVRSVSVLISMDQSLVAPAGEQGAEKN
jgi:hypothetical protein